MKTGLVWGILPPSMVIDVTRIMTSEWFGVIGSACSILALLLFLLMPRVVRMVRSENDLLKHLAEAHLHLQIKVRAKKARPPKNALTSVSETVSPELANALTESQAGISRCIGIVSGVFLSGRDLPHLEIARALERQGEAGTAAWFYERACNDRFICELQDDEVRRCLAGLETCQLALWRLGEAIDTHQRRLRLQKRRRNGGDPNLFLEQEPWISLGLGSKMLFVSVKFGLRAMFSLLLRRKTRVLVLRND